MTTKVTKPKQKRDAITAKITKLLKEQTRLELQLHNSLQKQLVTVNNKIELLKNNKNGDLRRKKH